MSDILAKANERRQVLATELKELETFISMYRRLEGDTDTPPREAKAPQSKRTPRSRGVRQGASGDIIVKAIREVIRERGEPMNRTQIVKALEARGVVVGGVDKPRNIGTIVWRSKAFDGTDAGYWPKGVPMPGNLV